MFWKTGKSHSVVGYSRSSMPQATERYSSPGSAVSDAPYSRAAKTNWSNPAGFVRRARNLHPKHVRAAT
jgi:hypothetical protein